MILSQREQEQILLTFKLYSLKLLSRTCMANLRCSFTRLLLAAQLPARGRGRQGEGRARDKAARVLVRLMKEFVWRKKKMVFNWMDKCIGERGYWRAKACVLMTGVLQVRINNGSRIGFTSLITHSHSPKNKKSQQQQVYALHKLTLLSKTKQSQLLSDAFHSIHSHSHRPKTAKPAGTNLAAAVGLIQLMEAVTRKGYACGFEVVQRYRRRADGLHVGERRVRESQQGGYDSQEQNIQLNQIKSIVITGLSHPHKPTTPTQTLSAKQKSIQTIQSVLSQVHQQNLQQSFSLLKWRLIQSYDQEMIDKLQIQIVMYGIFRGLSSMSSILCELYIDIDIVLWMFIKLFF